MEIIDTGVLGTRSAVIRLRRPGSKLEFVLFPMLHVASPEFYAEVTRRLAECAVVVAEGVSGRSVLGWALTMTYRVVPANRRSGLVLQNIDYRALDVEVIRPDVSADELVRGWRTLPLWFRALVWCALPFVVIAQFFGGRKRLLAPEVVVSDADLPISGLEERFLTAFRDERDARLLAALFKLHKSRSAERISVAVVYGACHVPDLVHQLAGRLGYRPCSAEWITAVEW